MQLPPPGAAGLAIFTPALAGALLAKWMRAYNPYYEIIAPHITVAYRGFAPPNEWRIVREQFANVIRTVPSFEVTLKTTGAFAGKEFVLWLKPEDDGSLMRLRTELAQKFPAYFPAEPFPYVPHLTIGFFNSREALEQAQATVRAELVPIRFRAEMVTYMVYDADGMWGDADHLSLGQ